MVSWFRGKPKEAPAVPSAVHRGAGDPQAVGADPPRTACPTTSPAPSFPSPTRARPTTGWSRPAARWPRRIELHGIKVVGADIDMRPLANGVAIPAGNTMTLKPRGYHLLLLG